MRQEYPKCYTQEGVSSQLLIRGHSVGVAPVSSRRLLLTAHVRGQQLVALLVLVAFLQLTLFGAGLELGLRLLFHLVKLSAVKLQGAVIHASNDPVRLPEYKKCHSA